MNECENWIWWVEKTLGDGGVSFCNIHIFKSYHALNWVSWWRYTIQLYASITIFFCLKLLCEYCIIRALRVYPSNEDIASLTMVIVTLNLHWWGNGWFYHGHSQCFSSTWGHCSFGFMVHVNHLWWIKILCGIWHDKYVQCGIWQSRPINWDWKRKWVRNLQKWTHGHIQNYI